jgi:hypothetical protein
VHAEGDAEPACVHESATEAQISARRIAVSRGAAAVVVVHDRYGRPHVTPVRAPASRPAGCRGHRTAG